MSFHYIREPGDEGQIIAGDGDAPGTPLTELLAHGPMPVRAALELVAYLGDLLTIAEEDQVSHGDLKPGFVKIDETGAVGLEGFGEERRGGRAPEGAPVGIATDTYGLGVVLHAALTGEGIGAIPRDRDAHDDAIVDRLLAIDWQDLSDKPWLEDIRGFLCTMLAHEPDERPLPLDVANLMGQVGMQAGGDGITAWAASVVGRAPEDNLRRSGSFSADEEDLGGPQALSAPVAQDAGLKIRKAASAKGEATAFWSRDRIAAMLAEEEDEGPVRASFKPSKPARSSAPTPPPPSQGPPPLVASPDRATFYGEDQADRIADSKLEDGPTLFESAPPELNSLGPGRLPPPGPVPLPQQPGRAAPPPSPPPPVASGAPFQPAGGPPPAQPPPPTAPPVAQSPYAQGPVAQSPYAQGPVAQSPYAQGPVAQGGYAPSTAAPPPAQESSGGKGALGVGLVVIALVLLCGVGGSIAGVLAYMNMGDGGGEEVIGSAGEDPGEEPREKVDTAVPPADDKAATEDKTEEKVEEAPKSTSSSTKSTSSSSSTKSSSSGSSSSSSTKSSSSGSSTRKSSSSGSSSSGSSSSGSSSSGSTSGGTASSGTTSGGSSGAKAPGESRTVKVSVQGSEALLQCGDGQQAEFVGSTRMTFTDVTTCRVKVGASIGVITVQTDSSFSCSESGGRVSCVQQ